MRNLLRGQKGNQFLKFVRLLSDTDACSSEDFETLGITRSELRTCRYDVIKNSESKVIISRSRRHRPAPVVSKEMPAKKPKKDHTLNSDLVESNILEDTSPKNEVDAMILESSPFPEWRDAKEGREELSEFEEAVLRELNSSSLSWGLM
eukprot:TRINITY_DN4191_c0_g1_i1.p1 TRINITY_DN4191_c0_g1~~TRINITY_DN4191_c0_g1_i1.p1  ORF type:complete len:149 (-),score=24.64 TRINITY_DN4191_c0_g1_i1:26-472(-)